MFDFLKSIIRSPFKFLTYASFIFHSYGIFQSKTLVPVRTSIIFKSICFCRIFKVFLRPFPVILLHIGKRFSINEKSSFWVFRSPFTDMYCCFFIVLINYFFNSSINCVVFILVSYNNISSSFLSRTCEIKKSNEFFSDKE